MRFTSRVEDFLSGLRPDPPKDSAPDAEPDPHEAAVGRRSDDG
jgi:hypothetical protein